MDATRELKGSQADGSAPAAQRVQQEGKLLAELNEAQLKQKALRRSRTAMIAQYDEAIRLGDEFIDQLWNQYRERGTDVSGLPKVKGE